MPKRSVFLYLTHFIDREVENEVARLAEELGDFCDVVLLLNLKDPGTAAQAQDVVPVFVTVEKALLELPFPNKVSAGFFPENVDLPMIDFYRRNPLYEHYWLAEYDVRFTGNWRGLLSELAGSTADLLCTNVARYAVSPSWHRRFPLRLPEGLSVPFEARIRAFFPFYRISRRALDTVVEAYAAGWGGHYEVAVPTLLHRAGLTLEDIGGSGEFVRARNRNKFYLSETRIHSLSPGTFVYRPVFRAPGRRANTLWHPVKPDHSFEMDTVRQTSLRYLYRLLLAARLALRV